MGIGILLAAHKEGGDHGSEDADRGDDQRIKRAGALEGDARHGHAQGEGGDDRAYVGLKQVGAHAGHVAHVVAHVVGDDGGVARVVLGDTDLDLADEVGADVGRLGVDAAADTREERDGRGAQREAEHIAEIIGDVNKAAAQEAQTDDAHAHDRAAGEGDREGLVHTALHRGVRGTDVGAGGHPHAEEAGCDRKQRAEQKADRGPDIDKDRDQRKEHNDEDREDLILGGQKSVGALGDGGGDLLHAGIARRSLGHIPGLVGGKQQSDDREDRGEPDNLIHHDVSSQKSEKRESLLFTLCILTYCRLFFKV